MVVFLADNIYKRLTPDSISSDRSPIICKGKRHKAKLVSIIIPTLSFYFSKFISYKLAGNGYLSILNSKSASFVAYYNID